MRVSAQLNYLSIRALLFVLYYLSQEEYDELHKDRMLKQLKYKAKLLGMTLIPNK